MKEDSFAFVILAFALAVCGGALGATLGTSHKRLCALISVGAGSLLGVTVFAILPETMRALNWWQLSLGLASGERGLPLQLDRSAHRHRPQEHSTQCAA